MSSLSGWETVLCQTAPTHWRYAADATQSTHRPAPAALSCCPLHRSPTPPVRRRRWRLPATSSASSAASSAARGATTSARGRPARWAHAGARQPLWRLPFVAACPARPGRHPFQHTTPPALLCRMWLAPSARCTAARPPWDPRTLPRSFVCLTATAGAAPPTPPAWRCRTRLPHTWRVGAAPCFLTASSPTPAWQF